MHLQLRIDGGARGNPGPAAAGVFITDTDGTTVFAAGFYLGHATNNVAEYSALVRGLQHAKQLGGTKLDVFCDSELVVKQVNGLWRVKNPNLKKLCDQAKFLLAKFQSTSVKHVRREQNTEADALVNQALDCRADVHETPETASGDPATNTHQNNLAQHTLPPPNLADLEQLINFRDTEPVTQIVTQANGLKTALICLNPNQSCQFSDDWSHLTILVIRGAGTISTGPDKHRAQPEHPAPSVIRPTGPAHRRPRPADGNTGNQGILTPSARPSQHPIPALPCHSRQGGMFSRS